VVGAHDVEEMLVMKKARGRAIGRSANARSMVHISIHVFPH
jgi:hypothetical protein